MRLAIDLQPLQSRLSRNRGIGRYVSALLEAMVRRSPDGMEYSLYSNASMPEPEEQAMRAVAAGMHSLPLTPEGHAPANEALLLAHLATGGFDALFLPSPMEGDDTVIPNLAGLPFPFVTISYDLIPLIYPSEYLLSTGESINYRKRLENIRRADYVFAISEATRIDTIEHLGVSPERVINIMGGVSPFFRPVESADEKRIWLEHFRVKYGIDRPFIMYTGGDDWRKNIDGLVRSFAVLPPDVRRNFQLVVACKMPPHSLARLQGLGGELGVGDSLVFTNFVPDEDLRALYGLCHLFVFPSKYEGFGLPLVEAMACGAPVIASNGSSLPEVVGAQDQLFDPASPESIAECMQPILVSESRRAELVERSRQRVPQFTWDAVGGRVEACLKTLNETVSVRRRLRSRPGFQEKMAYFSPLPPTRSGISDYSAELVPELRRHFDVELFVDAGTEPTITRRGAFPCFDNAFFPIRTDVQRVEYGAVLYQMGNSDAHERIYANLLRYPGITTLHDYHLGEMAFHMSRREQELGVSFAAELAHNYGAGEAASLIEQVAQNQLRYTDMMPRGLNVNRRIFTRSLGVVVHSPYTLRQALTDFGADNPNIVCIPQLMARVPALRDPAENAAIRAKYGIPGDGFLIVAAGFILESKRPIATLDAFATYLSAHPDAFLLFVGTDAHYPGDFAAEIRKRGLEARVKVTGYVRMDELEACIALADICLNLRFPFRGETSAALLRLLAQGKPVVVTDIGSFSDFPDDVVHKIPTPERGDEVAEIVRALKTLAEDTAYRQRLGRSAADYIAREHDPARCARLYAEFIQNVMRQPETKQKQLADFVGREMARCPSSPDPRADLAPACALIAAERP